MSTRNLPLIALLSLAAAPAAASEYQCPYTRNIFSSRVRDVAYTEIDFRSPARSRIVYNADFALRYAFCDGRCIEYVVSGHECTHASGVMNELKADCGGVKLMMQAGRWSAAMKASVARSLIHSEPDAAHPAGPVRIRNVEACERSTASLDRAPPPAPPAPPAPAAPPPAEARPAAPEGGACYYAILGCYSTAAVADAERARLGAALSVVHTDDVSVFRKGYYCVTGRSTTQEAAYTTVTNYRTRVPSAYVKKGC